MSKRTFNDFMHRLDGADIVLPDVMESIMVPIGDFDHDMPLPYESFPKLDSKYPNMLMHGSTGVGKTNFCRSVVLALQYIYSDIGLDTRVFASTNDTRPLPSVTYYDPSKFEGYAAIRKEMDYRLSLLRDLGCFSVKEAISKSWDGITQIGLGNRLQPIVVVMDCPDCYDVWCNATAVTLKSMLTDARYCNVHFICITGDPAAVDFDFGDGKLLPIRACMHTIGDKSAKVLYSTMANYMPIEDFGILVCVPNGKHMITCTQWQVPYVTSEDWEQVSNLFDEEI